MENPNIESLASGKISVFKMSMANWLAVIFFAPFIWAFMLSALWIAVCILVFIFFFLCYLLFILLAQTAYSGGLLVTGTPDELQTPAWVWGMGNSFLWSIIVFVLSGAILYAVARFGFKGARTR